MKKRLLTLALGIATCFTLHAQFLTTATEEKTEVNSETTKENYEALDYFGSWDSDTKILGLGMGTNIGSLLYFEYGMNYCLKPFLDSGSFKFGLGLNKRLINENFLLQVKAFPYIGLLFYDVETYNPETDTTSSEIETDFTYGAQARLEAGVKLFETKKNNSVFVTLGYEITAPEFETKNMFDNGCFVFGITLIK